MHLNVLLCRHVAENIYCLKAFGKLSTSKFGSCNAFTHDRNIYVHVCQSLFLDWIRQKCLRNKYIHKSNRILKTLSTQYCTLLTKNGRLKIKTTFIWLLLWLICSFLVLHFGIILCTLCIFYSGFIRIWTVFFLYIVCLLCGLKLASEWWLS